MEEIMGKYELVRQDDGFTPETLLIIGNEAISEVWNPLKTTLDEMRIAIDDYPVHPRKVGYEISLALIAMQNKQAKELIIRELVSILNGSTSDFDEMKNSFWVMESICQPFRQALAKVYESTKEISIKKNMLNFLKEEGFEEASTGILTTNWDNVLWDYESKKLRNLIHIHGRCSSWKTIMFPTETAEGNTYYMLMTKDLENRFEKGEELGNQIKESCLSLLRNAFKPPKNETDYWHNFSVHQGYAHGRALKWIREAKRLVVCGVPFHSHEHELLSIFIDKKVTDSPEKWEEIVVIGLREEDKYKIAGLLKVDSSICRYIDARPFWRKIFNL